MAKVVFKGIKKIYPLEAKKGRKKQEEISKTNLQLVDEGFVAVQEFDLEIQDKEFIVLVGPSGCGKSTTLRMVAGLEEISGGELYIGDTLVNNVEPKDRNIAMVFQSYALYPHMTVYDNMAYALKLRNEPKDSIDKKVREAAKILDIEALLTRKPRALSGGQRQRVAIGRAIVRNPQVFLMDEPLSNLDAKLRNQMRSEIIKLRQRINTTFIYVTHDQVEATTLGDRIVVMKDGFIQQIGTPIEVFDKPANQFVAGFIGTPQMNFFDATLNKDGDGYSLMFNGMKVELSADIQEKLKESGVEPADVVMGIRPEHIALADQNMSATVDVCEMLGSSAHLHLDIGGQRAVMVLHNRGLNDVMFKNGDKIGICFQSDRIHIFNKETGKNVLYS